MKKRLRALPKGRGRGPSSALHQCLLEACDAFGNPKWQRELSNPQRASCILTTPFSRLSLRGKKEDLETRAGSATRLDQARVDSRAKGRGGSPTDYGDRWRSAKGSTQPPSRSRGYSGRRSCPASSGPPGSPERRSDGSRPPQASRPRGRTPDASATPRGGDGHAWAARAPARPCRETFRAEGGGRAGADGVAGGPAAAVGDARPRRRLAARGPYPSLRRAL